jgi:hypothetical protein
VRHREGQARDRRSIGVRAVLLATVIGASGFANPTLSTVFASPTLSTVFASPTLSTVFASPTLSTVFASPTLTTIFASPSLTTMKAALEKGDLDEASRQGVLAGAAVIESALASPDRATVLAGIAAAPRVEGRADLLESLGKLAAGPDRRVAIPAARAAVAIAREMVQSDPPDDLADADVTAWRDRFAEVALDRTRWIEVRVLAVDAAAYLERAREPAMNAGASGAPSTGASSTGASSTGASSTGASSTGASSTGASSTGASSTTIAFDASRADVLGIAWTSAMSDADPAFRRAVLAHVPAPTPPSMWPHLAKVIGADGDPLVALAATAALCADLAFDPPAPILAALGTNITRVQSIVTTSGASRGHLREAARCLAADKSPASTAALRKIRNLR